MLNIAINMCEKFNYYRVKNDRALGNRKSDNNPKKKHNNNVGSAWGPVSGSTMVLLSSSHRIGRFLA